MLRRRDQRAAEAAQPPVGGDREVIEPAAMAVRSDHHRAGKALAVERAQHRRGGAGQRPVEIVARIVLAPRTRELTSGFVRVPLDMRDPYGLAALACIITATPGTVWVEYDSAKGTMLLHVLDLIDGDDWVRIIKDRYERRLMEIFG